MVGRFSVRTSARSETVDITGQIEEAVRASGVRSGVCYAFVPHTTAGITINEGADPAVAGDFITHLDKLVPWGAAYRHREGNAASHIKAGLVGTTATVLVEDGRLVLGVWQAIFLCEFDGPKEREVLVKVMGQVEAS